MCAVSAHDVGNLYGRANHENKIYQMIDEACKNVIDDSIEIRIVSRIAGVHSGKITGRKDTISFLKNTDTINNFEVREKMLAAVLRFADELADDSTRQNDVALSEGILGFASEIFHIYSSKLHTVKLKQNPVNKSWDVKLVYAMDDETAKQKYFKGKNKVYLLDEIYERTIKMERERRYCMRFLRPFCAIEGIDVEITIEYTGDIFSQESITYRLEEKGYPDTPYASIKDVDSSIATGEEMADKLSKGK